MDYKTKRILGDCVGGAICALIVALAAHGCTAHAQPAEPLAQYAALDSSCRGAPLDNPDCARRDGFARRLVAQGWTQGDADVWVSPQQSEQMRGAIWAALTAAGLQRNLVAGSNAFAARLRADRIPDEIAIAWWRANADYVQSQNPPAWAMGSNVIGGICLYHAKDNDPRFRCD